MSMGNCKDCKHWQSPDLLQKIYLGINFTMGRCLLAGSDDGAADHPQSLAFADDAESYSAWLNTSPDFGCVQFEAKEAKATTLRSAQACANTESMDEMRVKYGDEWADDFLRQFADYVKGDSA